MSKIMVEIDGSETTTPSETNAVGKIDKWMLAGTEVVVNDRVDLYVCAGDDADSKEFSTAEYVRFLRQYGTPSKTDPSSGRVLICLVPDYINDLITLVYRENDTGGVYTVVYNVVLKVDEIILNLHHVKQWPKDTTLYYLKNSNIVCKEAFLKENGEAMQVKSVLNKNGDVSITDIMLSPNLFINNSLADVDYQSYLESRVLDICKCEDHSAWGNMVQEAMVPIVYPLYAIGKLYQVYVSRTQLSECEHEIVYERFFNGVYFYIYKIKA